MTGGELGKEERYFMGGQDIWGQEREDLVGRGFERCYGGKE